MKNTESKPDAEALIAEPKDTSCIDLTEYYKITDKKESLLWLKNNGPKVCQNILEENLKKEHVVEDTNVFRGMYEQTKPTTKYSMKEIDSIIGNNKYYDNWINCEVDSKGVVKLSMGDFTEKNSCYSIPLFNYIKKSEISATEYEQKIIEFKRNKDDTKVVFSVKKNFNYSQQPLLHRTNL